MEENVTTTARRPRRRRKTPMEIFKEAYLPYLILITAVVLIVSFIIGALVRANADKPKDTAAAPVCVTVLEL